MKVGVVDIGTNSMRLLITDGNKDEVRRAEVTGLGEGLDASRRLGESQMAITLDVLRRFGEIMEHSGVDRRAAIATSATRDAANRVEFVSEVSAVLGVAPDVIDGTEEARLSFAGAMSDLDGEGWIVCDIGGGSTEFATESTLQSIDIGSVRLNDRFLGDRPPTPLQMTQAAAHVRELFESTRLHQSGGLVGAAGTWTTLAAMDLGLDEYRSDRVHHHVLSADGLQWLITRMSGMTISETIDAFPGIDPRRAPVILSGAVVAQGVLDRVGRDNVLVSERDSLDGLAAATLALA